MFSRLDVVSEKTGRVLLRAAFDSPPDGLTRKECQQVLLSLANAKKDLERVLGHDMVRLSLDDYASSVFWFMVLHRQLTFDSDHLLSGRPWSIYEFCMNPNLARRLKRLDLGVVYDETHNWLTVLWPEAFDGILQELELSPTWGGILKREEKRLGKVTDNWWKACASAHSFVVPAWRLSRLDYLSRVLWHQPGLTYNDITVFDLAGVDIPTVDQNGLAVLPAAKRARFVHFYAEDKREFQNTAKLMKNRKVQNPLRLAQYEMTKLWKSEQAQKKKTWRLAGRCLYRLSTLFGAGKLRVGGNYRSYLEADEADKLYDIALSQLKSGFPCKDWKRAKAILEELKTYLNNKYVPRNFRRWLDFEKEAITLLKKPAEEN